MRPSLRVNVERTQFIVTAKRAAAIVALFGGLGAHWVRTEVQNAELRGRISVLETNGLKQQAEIDLCKLRLAAAHIAP